MMAEMVFTFLMRASWRHAINRSLSKANFFFRIMAKSEIFEYTDYKLFHGVVYDQN